MNDRERITRLEIRCEQLQLTVNEAFHWIDILKSDLSDLQDRVGQADRKTDNSSEKPNNCKYAKNPSGDVWECGCFLDTYCEHQIYDRNPDGTINIVECGYEPTDEPQTETEIAKAIVHKMIDDAVIAEDAYPDLRQRMHEAVERLDEYYPSEDERSE